MHARSRLTRLEAAAARIAEALPRLDTIVVNLGSARFQNVYRVPRSAGPMVCLLDGRVVSQEALWAAMDSEDE